jgi:hypothetical protein
MNCKINALYLRNSKVSRVEIFGYTTKGIPGIDIINLGKYGRTIKEKFIYLTKEMQIKLPLRRYVICIESGDDQLPDIDNYQWLELPILLLFLSLAKQIPIQRLDDCFSTGKISISGKITTIPQNNLDHYITSFDNIKLIAPSSYEFKDNVIHIPLDKILSYKQKQYFIMDN